MDLFYKNALHLKKLQLPREKYIMPGKIGHTWSKLILSALMDSFVFVG